MTNIAYSTPQQIGLKDLGLLRRGLLVAYISDIENRLRELGAMGYDMILPETHYLPLVIHPDEEILGVVYGRYQRTTKPAIGRGVLVATDQRIILLDRKPMFTNIDEFVYDAVGGIDYTHAVLAGNITLHVAGGDIRLRTFNDKCARTFTEAVERQLGEGDQRVY